MPTLIDYIAQLERLRQVHGDLVSVEKWMPAKGRHEAPMPVATHARKYDARSGVPAFYHDSDNDVQKGDLVIRV